MFCQYCGNEVKAGTKFCTKCGQKILKDEDEETLSINKERRLRLIHFREKTLRHNSHNNQRKHQSYKNRGQMFRLWQRA